MKKTAWILGLALLCGIAGISAPASAEEKKLGDMTLSDLKKELGISAYVQAGYTYNGDPMTNVANSSTQNAVRGFDHNANMFQFDLAELVFLKDPSAGTAGYKIKIAAGETANVITAGASSFDITEAYVSYVAPIGAGLRFDMGKMGTFIGAEVMEALDNPNYSRSFLFNYAEPLAHTGLKVSYPVNDALSVAVFDLNGWDNSTDNNKAKTYGLSVGITPAEVFSASLNVIQGSENNFGRDKKTLADVVATIKPIKALTILLNYDSGTDEKALAGGADAKWSGLSAIAKYDFNDTYSLAVRGESFDDKDRAGHKLTEVTVTPEIRLDNGLVVRPEYRHDSSDQQEFADGTKKTQDTIALGVMYRW